MQTILSVQGVSKTYARAKKGYPLLKDLNFGIEKGKITAIVGGNGSGKTTLFNLISGLQKPDSGEIAFWKSDKKISLIEKSPFEISRLGIGRSFQDTHIFPNLTIEENMLIADENRIGENVFQALVYSNKWRKREEERKSKCLEIFKDLFSVNNSLENRFINRRHELAGTLSFGQQRLLGLARLFMQDYTLLLLDEPTAGVNPILIDQIAFIIKTLKSKGKTILLIEHNMRFMKRLSDHCIFLKNGFAGMEGTPEMILNNANVRKSYLGI